MRIAVVGAGIAGLVCAYELQQAGLEVHVYEQADRVGGRMATRHNGPWRFDTGANFLVQSYTCLVPLAERLGLPLVNLSPVPHVVLRDGECWPINFRSAGDVFRMLALPLATRIWFLVYAMRLRRKYPSLDFFDLSAVPDELNEENAYGLALRKVGQPFADYVVDAFHATMMFSRAQESSAGAFVSLFAMLASPHLDFSVLCPVGGMGAVPEALAAAVPVRTGVEVQSITPGWRVNDEPYERVVLACCQPGLLPPGAARDLLEDTRHAATINVSFRVPKQRLGPVHCFYVPWVESQLICEFTNEAVKGNVVDDWSLVNVGLHDAAARPLLEADESVVFERVALELMRLQPQLDTLVPYDMQRWPRAIPIYDAGQIRRVKSFLAHGQGQGGLYLCGDHMNAPWTEGAARSGRDAAQRLLAELPEPNGGGALAPDPPVPED